MLTEAQKSLVEENHNLIYYMLNKFNLPIDEFYDIAAIGLCEAAKDYEESKSKFSTFACKYMFREINKIFRLNKTIKRTNTYKNIQLNSNPNLKHIYINPVSINPVENEILFKISLNEILNSLNKKEFTIMKMLFAGFKQSDISHALKCRQGKVSEVKRKVINYCIA